MRDKVNIQKSNKRELYKTTRESEYNKTSSLKRVRFFENNTPAPFLTKAEILGIKYKNLKEKL